MSSTFSANATACISSAMPLNNAVYSFMPDPQPAALVTTASTSAGKAARLVRARSLAWPAAPMCIDSAPQQP